jgi:hypothetical protein
MAQSMQRSPAPEGRCSGRKWWRPPNEDTRRGGRPTKWLSQSMSCTLLAINMNVDSSVRRQLPRTKECA